MKTAWKFIAVGSFGLLIGGAGVLLSQQSALRQAFLHHQQQEIPEVKSEYGRAGGEDFIMTERWKQYQKYENRCPTIPEITSLYISKTSDSGDFVIKLLGPNAGKNAPDGFPADTCSLWLNGGKEDTELQVRDYTIY